MKANYPYTSPESEYFIHEPSQTAQDTYLFPIHCGIYSTLPGYNVNRESFDSFLLMYIRRGEMEVCFEGRSSTAMQGYFILLDCYQRHAYSSPAGCECLWCHYDGMMARSYYNLVVARLGNVFSMPAPNPALRTLTMLLDVFYKGERVREPLLSKYLTDILTEFLLYTPENSLSLKNADIAEDTITYINEHFQEDISVEDLALRASVSLYHFIRIFKKEVGITPHEYLVNTRIAHAKYLLTNTDFSVKDICFATGFSCESVFCSTFKKRIGTTPSQFREESEFSFLA